MLTRLLFKGTWVPLSHLYKLKGHPHFFSVQGTREPCSVVGRVPVNEHLRLMYSKQEDARGHLNVIY